MGAGASAAEAGDAGADNETTFESLGTSPLFGFLSDGTMSVDEAKADVQKFLQDLELETAIVEEMPQEIFEAGDGKAVLAGLARLGDSIDSIIQAAADGIARRIKDAVREMAEEKGVAEPKMVNRQSFIKAAEKKISKQRLRNLEEADIMVLDNSLRETTVAALRGHTPQIKHDILGEVRKCNFSHIIVAAFAGNKRVDDVFCGEMQASGEDFSSFYAFSEVKDSFIDGDGDLLLWDTGIPIAMAKMKEFGVPHPIIEVDLCCQRTDYDKLNLNDFIKDRLQWAVDELSLPARTTDKGSFPECVSRPVINLRDLCEAAQKCPRRVVDFVRFLAALPVPLRPFALITEDPTGEVLPCTFAQIVSSLRRFWPKRENGGQKGGHLLVHVHRSFGLAEAVVLQAIQAGADGIWCAIPMDGAQVGHACSAVTLTNLVRYKNQHVQTSYNCKELRDAAARISELTTGEKVHSSVEVYGPRAMDSVFAFPMGSGCFDWSTIEDKRACTRIHSLATWEQMRDRLAQCFPEHEGAWNEEALQKMPDLIQADLQSNVRNEYFSRIGIGMLYCRTGGHFSEEEYKALAASDEAATAGPLKSVYDRWVQYDDDDGTIDHWMNYRDFFDAFMARVFSCFRCDITEAALRLLDQNRSGYVSWVEFKVWLQWALREHPDETKTSEELVDFVMRVGLRSPLGQ